MLNPGFIHLRTHSAFSLLESTIKLPQLIKLCEQQKIPAVAVTDTANMFGALEFATLASKAGIQPITGALLRIIDGASDAEQQAYLIPLLVQGEVGYLNLMHLISLAYEVADQNAGVAAVNWDALKGRTEGLIALTGGATGQLNANLRNGQLPAADKAIIDLKALFPDRLYIEIQRHGVEAETRIESDLIDLAYKHDVPLVATNDAQFGMPELHEAHDALLCISQGVVRDVQERHRVSPEHWFKPASKMLELFSDLPEATANTVVIAQRCAFMPQARDPILPTFPTPDGTTEQEALRALAERGLTDIMDKRVYPHHPEEQHGELTTKYRDRFEFELGVIERMGFEGYFLIVADFIQWSKQNDIPVGPGRGSGAGSIIALALKITDLDPLEHHLLFERFLNPDRISMPDFDIDFCPERREEVIAYVQHKYGKDRVGQIITFGKLQARAVLRDVGRVLGMPYMQVDRVTKMVPNNPTAPMTLQQAIDADKEFQNLRNTDPAVGRLIAIALQLEGLYRHASTHAAGVVIGDRPLQELVPVYRDQKSDMGITQFDMRWAETAGLVKFDFLGLKTLTVIDKTLQIVQRNQGISLKVEDIPFDDPKTFEMLGRAEAIGVFQLESSGMRDILRKLKPDCLEDIIATVALYRPGPMDDIPAFIARKTGKEAIVFDHEELAPILEETYGVFVYQEQVMRASREMGRFTPGEADSLRKIMGKKIMSEMPKQREKFVVGAKESKIPEKLSGDIFDKMAKFGSYGFNKAHSACYGVVAYHTAYLKANFPVEFITANMILDMGNTDKLAVFKGECDRMNIKLLQPDLNSSEVDFSIEKNDKSLEGFAIRYALGAIKNVGANALKTVVQERKDKGPYSSLTEFAERVNPKAINRRTIENLACAGAFDSSHPNRRQVQQSADMVIRHSNAAEEARNSSQVSLFGEPGKIDLPEIQVPIDEPWTSVEQLSHEFAAIGFYLSAHPVEAFAGALQKLKVVPISNLPKATRPVLAGVVAAKSERTGKKGGRFAFITVSDQSGSCEVAVFSELFHSARELLAVGNMLLIKADPKGEGDEMRLIANSIEPLEQAVANIRNSITLYVSELAHIPTIRNILSNSGPGRDKLSVVLDLDDGSEAELRIAQGYSIPLKVQQAIRSLGVQLTSR